jgi:hypothetical protein
MVTVCFEVVTMDMSPTVPSKPRVAVHFVLPRERAPRSSAQQMDRLQLSGRTSQYNMLCVVIPTLEFQNVSNSKLPGTLSVTSAEAQTSDKEKTLESDSAL